MDEAFDTRFTRPRSMPPPAGPRARRDPGEDSRLAKIKEEIYWRLSKRLRHKMGVESRKQDRLARKAAKKLQHPAVIPQELRDLIGPTTISAIASRASMPISTVSVILRGLRNPSTDRFLALVQAIGCPPGDFYRYLKAAQSSPIKAKWMSAEDWETRKAATSAFIEKAARELSEQLAGLEPHEREARIEAVVGAA